MFFVDMSHLEGVVYGNSSRTKAARNQVATRFTPLLLGGLEFLVVSDDVLSTDAGITAELGCFW